MSDTCCPQTDPPPVPEHTEQEACCEIHPPATCGPAQCPACGALGKPVKRITLGALLKPEHRPRIPIQKGFCFCRTAKCEVVYFRPGEVLFQKEDLAVKVGLKEPNDPTVPVCYCFGWTPEKIHAEIEAAGKSTAVDQIKAQVKADNCYCEVTNPQGSCCLGNVTAAVQKAKERRRHSMLRTLLLIGFLTTLLGTGGQAVWAEVTEVELRIDGLSCPFCVFNIEKPLKQIGAAGSLQTNYKEGVLRMGVQPGQPVDLAQFRQAVADTGFSLRAIRLTAIGTMAQWEGHPALETRGTGQRFLLFKEEAETPLTPEHTIGDPALERRLAGWQSSGTLVKVSGTVHEHQGLPPALEIETILEVKP